MDGSLSYPDADYVLKVIMVGDAGVGKSCLLKAFKGEPVTGDYTSTIGVDFEIKSVVSHGKSVNLQIWDTAGQERFRTITTSYYRSSDAIILVFDITNQETFQHLEDWMQDVRLYSKPNVDIMVCGNKVDLKDKRQVEFKTAKEYADKHRMQYIETSAKSNINVETAFMKLTSAAVLSKVKEDGSAANSRTSSSSVAGKSKAAAAGAGAGADGNGSRTVQLSGGSLDEEADSGCKC